ncbi:hypothetical protein E2C01_007566 [Portunus trituberculatus]|uniref:Uncharacterized protein n=1 Tax=Portunus trituberculatus TaxID=210409 RepID=A0A5B7D0T0_PORTR|nr:hypothetical protein [Portunus trituberculatus]
MPGEGERSPLCKVQHVSVTDTLPLKCLACRGAAFLRSGLTCAYRSEEQISTRCTNINLLDEKKVFIIIPLSALNLHN